jgi:MFS family permease
MLLREPADGEDAGTGLPIAASTFRTSWMILSRDANFRRLAWIAACYGMSVSLVPHYVAYVRESLSIGMEGFLPWLIAQNIGAALFSIPLGQTADRAGNRLAIQWTMIGLTAAPLLSVCWVQWLASLPNIGFSLIFLLLGLTPISMRVFQNYTLEIVPRPQQPIYLSTLGACMAFPVVAFSIPVGWVVDVAGFEPVFWLVIVILLISWVMTFGLSEPRDGFETDGTLGPLMTGPK